MAKACSQREMENFNPLRMYSMQLLMPDIFSMCQSKVSSIILSVLRKDDFTPLIAMLPCIARMEVQWSESSTSTPYYNYTVELLRLLLMKVQIEFLSLKTILKFNAWLFVALTLSRWNDFLHFYPTSFAKLQC